MDFAYQKAIEYGLVAFAFIFLLIFVTKTMYKLFSDGFKEISVNLVDFGKTLKEVSNTLVRIDLRIEQLEKRVVELESEKRAV